MHREVQVQNGQNGKDRNPAQGQDMGDDLMIEIDEGDDDERADEEEHDGIGRRQTVSPEEQVGEDRGEDLDQADTGGRSSPGSPGTYRRGGDS